MSGGAFARKVQVDKETQTEAPEESQTSGKRKRIDETEDIDSGVFFVTIGQRECVCGSGRKFWLCHQNSSRNVRARAERQELQEGVRGVSSSAGSSKKAHVSCEIDDPNACVICMDATTEHDAVRCYKCKGPPWHKKCERECGLDKCPTCRTKFE